MCGVPGPRQAKPNPHASCSQQGEGPARKTEALLSSGLLEPRRPHRGQEGGEEHPGWMLQSSH